MHEPAQTPEAVAWASFVHSFVNVSARLRAERPALEGSLPRQGALACVLFLCAGRPRLSVPVAGLPAFRRQAVEELIAAGELLPCASPRGSAFVAPALLLDAVRQLPQAWQARLLEGDPAAGIWERWLAQAPSPRPLTEVAVELLADADDLGAAAPTAERLAGIAAGVGLSEVTAMARGAARIGAGPERTAR